MKEAPSHDRSIFTIRDKPNNRRRLSFSDHIEFQSLPLLLGKNDSIEERKKETMKIVLPLTKAQMETLKNAANSALNDNGDGVSRGFSRYEVLASHIWRCASKARGHEYEQPTSLSFSMDVRSRLHTTPIAERYFGNTILLMRVRSQAGELISNPLGFACRKLREAINKVDEDYIWSNFDLLEEKKDISFYLNDSRVLNTTKEGNPFHVNPNFRVVNWLRLPIRDMDFGWGSKIDTIPIASDIDGSSHLLPGPKDDGSAVVVLSLQVAHVENFKKHFYEDV